MTLQLCSVTVTSHPNCSQAQPNCGNWFPRPNAGSSEIPSLAARRPYSLTGKILRVIHPHSHSLNESGWGCYGLTVSAHLLTPSLERILIHHFLKSRKLARLSSRHPGCPCVSRLSGSSGSPLDLRRRFKAFVSCPFPGDRGFLISTS